MASLAKIYENLRKINWFLGWAEFGLKLLFLAQRCQNGPIFGPSEVTFLRLMLHTDWPFYIAIKSAI